jgi:hypothetical protein
VIVVAEMWEKILIVSHEIWKKDRDSSRTYMGDMEVSLALEIWKKSGGCSSRHMGEKWCL